jgi:hypothetical protein
MKDCILSKRYYDPFELPVSKREVKNPWPEVRLLMKRVNDRWKAEERVEKIQQGMKRQTPLTTEKLKDIVRAKIDTPLIKPMRNPNHPMRIKS